MLRSVVAATDRYRVFVNNMVSGRGCDSGFHPRGMAVDFNTVVDPRTGLSTNWHTGSSSDNRALDREFLTFTARAITSGGGAGQRNCAGSAGAAYRPGWPGSTTPAITSSWTAGAESASGSTVDQDGPDGPSSRETVSTSRSTGSRPSRTHVAPRRSNGSTSMRWCAMSARSSGDRP